MEPSVTPEVVHVDDDEIVAGLQQLRRQRIDTRLVTEAIAHRAAIDPRHVDVVDETERQLRGLLRLCLVQVYMRAEPHETVIASERRNVPAFPVPERCRRGLPRRRVAANRPRLRAL